VIRLRGEAKPVDVGLRYLSLGYRLRRLVDDRMTAGGLSLAGTKILQVLDRHGTLRQSLLAEGWWEAGPGRPILIALNVGADRLLIVRRVLVAGLAIGDRLIAQDASTIRAKRG
jgi:hypothetical protein